MAEFMGRLKTLTAVRKLRDRARLPDLMKGSRLL